MRAPIALGADHAPTHNLCVALRAPFSLAHPDRSSLLVALQPVRPRQHAPVRPLSACRQSVNLALAQARAANRTLAHGTRTNRIRHMWVNHSPCAAHSGFIVRDVSPHIPVSSEKPQWPIITIGLRLVMDGVHTSQWPWPSQGCEDRLARYAFMAIHVCAMAIATVPLHCSCHNPQTTSACFSVQVEPTNRRPHGCCSFSITTRSPCHRTHDLQRPPKASCANCTIACRCAPPCLALTHAERKHLVL